MASHHLADTDQIVHPVPTSSNKRKISAGASYTPPLQLGPSATQHNLQHLQIEILNKTGDLAHRHTRSADIPAIDDIASIGRESSKIAARMVSEREQSRHRAASNVLLPMSTIEKIDVSTKCSNITMLFASFKVSGKNIRWFRKRLQIMQ